MQRSHSLPVEEEVDGDDEAEDDDDGTKDAVADAAGIAGAGIAADGAGDHHEPAEAPLDGAGDDEGDDGDTIGGGSEDHFEGVHLGDAVDAAEREGGEGEQAGAGPEVADVVADDQLRGEHGDYVNARAMLGVGGVVFGAAAHHARERAAEGKGDRTQEEQIRDEAQEGFLAAAQKGERAGESTDEGDDDDGDDEADVLPDFFAVAGDGGELAGPEGDGSSGVGLDGEQTGFEEGGKDEESAAAGDRVDEAAETSSEGEEDVLEERGVHCF